MTRTPTALLLLVAALLALVPEVLLGRQGPPEGRPSPRDAAEPREGEPLVLRPGPIVPHRTGTHRVTFETAHPEASLSRLGARHGWSEELLRKHDPEARYATSEQSWVLHVPAGYDRTRPFGLLVWIPVQDDGAWPMDWFPVLEDKRVVIVCPDRAGNEAFVWYRAALALDAVQGVSAAYAIDPERVWVGGYSGGGRVASRLAMHHPETFRGGLYNGGVNHFRTLRSSGEFARSFPARIPQPRGAVLRQARTASRHVFVFGETDPNRRHAELVRRDLHGRRFAHLTWIDLPERGHVYADAASLAAALEAFDAPLLAARAKAEARRRRLEEKAEKAAERGHEGGGER